jgi:hypothetical protein
MSPSVSECNNRSETENSNMSTEALSTNTATGLAFSAQDIDIPRLNVIQKMSEIEGPIGSVVIDKDSVLLEAEQKTSVSAAPVQSDQSGTLADALNLAGKTQGKIKIVITS